MTRLQSLLIGALLGGCLSVQATPTPDVGDAPVITITVSQLKKATFGLACVGILGFMAYKAWNYWISQPIVASKKTHGDKLPTSADVPPVVTKSLTSEGVSLDVQQQDGAYCGYHAAYNGVTLLKWILQGERGDRPVLTSECELPLFDLDSWKKRIIADRLAVNPELPADLRNGMWLEADPELRTVIMHKDVGNLSDHFTIIPNVETFHPVQMYDDRDRKTLISAMSALNDYRGNYAHLFLIGNMQEREGSGGRIGGTRGHWIAVVVHRKENHITYYVMDSLSDDIEEGCKRDRTPMIIGLKRIIENERTLQLLQQTPHFSDLADTIYSQLHNKELRTSLDVRFKKALDKMREIYVKADKYQLFDDLTFKQEYGKQLRGYLTTMEERINQMRAEHHNADVEAEKMAAEIAVLQSQFKDA